MAFLTMRFTRLLHLCHLSEFLALVLLGKRNVLSELGVFGELTFGGSGCTTAANTSIHHLQIRFLQITASMFCSAVEDLAARANGQCRHFFGRAAIQ